MKDSKVVIVGAGAAGLATAIFGAGCGATLLESARKPGAKILVSGGGRCNVTNRVVGELDFWGGKRSIVRRVLRAFDAERTSRWFADLGVPLHEEADGKLFPDSNRARDVLDALLVAADRAGATICADHQVVAVDRARGGFVARTSRGDFTCRRLVLATGGQSLPKSGSDGRGFAFAERLGHTIVPTTPALAPLTLDGDMHAGLSGVAVDVELTLWVEDRAAIRVAGPMLWTHFGISGPAALNLSRHYLRAALERRPTRVTVNFCREPFDSIDARWLRLARERPKLSVAAAMAEFVPGSVATALLARLNLAVADELSRLARGDRRRIAHALTDWPLPVTGSRGYTFAEATAGGVALDEIDPATMQSRVCPGLFLVGEVLDVDGRLGGFNFQWAWSSAYVAGNALATDDCD